MYRNMSEKGRECLAQVKAFMREEIEPAEPAFWQEVEANCPGGDWRNWKVCSATIRMTC